MLRHPRVGAEHLLVGLSAEPVGAGGRALRALGLDLGQLRAGLAAQAPADDTRLGSEEADALRTLGIDLDEVRRTIEERFGAGALDRAGRGRDAGGHVPFAPEAKKALELSLREALRLGDKHIGSEHIALALLRLGEGSGASQMLRARGVDPHRFRDQLEREIEHGGDAQTA
jgi:ATP-dependent Clp protease ATP-binding subunit ClpA